jgi:hypothetical protein
MATRAKALPRLTRRGSSATVVPSSLPFNLQQMTRAGVLTARPDGQSIFYLVNHDGIAALRELLSGLLNPGNAHRDPQLREK